jgi:uncharacterized membrane protein
MSRNRISARLVSSAILLSSAMLFGTRVALSQQVPFNFRSFDVPGATFTRATGINPEGNIVGAYAIGTVFHSYLLSKGMVTTVDPPYGIPGGNQVAAQGINPQGDIVGLYTDYGTIVGGDAFRTRSYLRDASGDFTRIDFPGAENTLAIKISPTGQVVGCYHHQDKDFAVSGGGTMHGFVYQNGSYQSLPVPGTMHNGITPDGGIIAGVWFPTLTEFHAYKVEDGVYALLDLPGYVVSSDARDINPSGEIVGFFVDSSNKNHGFLLNREGFTPIDFPGADVVFTQARGIDPEGNIVGGYMTRDAQGMLHTHGFVATRSQGQHNSIILP